MIRLFRVLVPASTLVLLIADIVMVTATFVLITHIVLQVDPTVFLFFDGGLTQILIALGCILLGLYFSDLYARVRVKSRIVLAQQLSLVVGAALILQGLISYLDFDLSVPVRVMIPSCGISLLVLFGVRVLFSKYARQVTSQERVLLVGKSRLLQIIGEHVEQHPETGLQIVGCVADNREPETELTGGKILGNLGSLRDIALATQPGHIVVGMSGLESRAALNELLELRFAGHIVEEAATTYERVCRRVSLAELQPSRFMELGELGPHSRGVIYQMIFNLVLASLGILLLAPAMLVAALAILLSSPGPVFCRQTRSGMNGVPFLQYKLRLRLPDAVSTGSAGAWLMGVRRLVHRFRIDALPQLLNVLKGEMAIVGPSPERPEFAQALLKMVPYYGQRHSVRPGITGWAQINGGYGDTLEDTIAKLEYDLYYIKNMSLSLDTYIVLHTMKGILLSHDA